MGKTPHLSTAKQDYTAAFIASGAAKTDHPLAPDATRPGRRHYAKDTTGAGDKS
jgi:hypothetical protein